MPRSIRYTSQAKLFGLPLLAIAQGPEHSRDEQRGHARGIIAIGDVATGFIAIGGIARGFIAVGGVGFGLFTVAGVGVGALVIAGVAVAQTAFGGVAVGQYAKGGVAVGVRVICSKRVDQEAVEWFSRLKLHSHEVASPAPAK